MTDRVRIGVIGLGIMGEQYVRIYNAHPLATVTAICTRRQERLNEIGDKYGIKTRVTDYLELLNRSDIDAVCVATPDFAHHAPVKAALEANKHVLCEKPFTTLLSEADELLSFSRGAQASKASSGLQPSLAFILLPGLCIDPGWRNRPPHCGLRAQERHDLRFDRNDQLGCAVNSNSLPRSA